MTPIVFILVMLALVWFVLIQPQRRRQQATKRMVEGVNVGDEVLTAGGMYATVREVRADDLSVEIAPGTTIRLDKRAIALVLTNEHEELERSEAVQVDGEPDELSAADGPRRRRRRGTVAGRTNLVPRRHPTAPVQLR